MGEGTVNPRIQSGGCDHTKLLWETKFIDELKDVLKAYRDEEIFVIGGAMFYRTMLPYCESVLVTKVDADGEAQVFFENLDEMENWSMTDCSESVKSGEIDIRFTTYTNSAPVNFFD